MNDLEFAQRCASGDKQAWGEFVDRYSRLIYNYIHSVLRTKSPDQFSQDSVGDIFQEIFILLAKDNFKKLRSFKAKNGCSLASWLRQVVINYTIDYIRKFKPMLSIEESSNDELSLKDILPDDAVTVTETLTAQEKIAFLKDCIQELDTDDKYFLELYLNRGLTLQDLRGVFRISRGAIDMRKSRIIKRLKECFKTKGFLLDF